MFYYALEMQPVQTVSVKDTLVFEDLVGKKSFKKNSVVTLITYRNIWNMLGEMGFLVAQMVKNPPAMQETLVQSLVWEDLLKEGEATHSSILA